METPRRLALAWGVFIARRRWYVLAGWLLLVLAMAWFAASTARSLSPAGFETDTQAARAADVLKEQFPDRRAPALAVVFQSDSTHLDDAGYQSQLAAWKADLERLAARTSTRESPTVVAGPILGGDRRTAALLLESSQQPAHFLAAAREAGGIRHDGPAQVFIGGFAAVYNNFVADSEQDLAQSERLSAPIALILLLLVFGGVVAGALPVLTGLGTVTVALALLGFVARLHTVSVFSLNVTSVVGLGLGIDYSLLVVNRFREELRAGADRETAVARTVGTAGLATAVSGGTVAIGFGALMLSRLNVLWSIGLGGSIVVLVSVLASLTLIPALLAVFGARVDSLALPFTRNRSLAGFWRGLAASVMRRPLLFILISLAVTLVLAAPARALRPGVLGSESLPPDDGAVRAQTLGESRLGFPRHQPAILVARGVRDLNQARELQATVGSAAGGQPVTGPANVPPRLLGLYFKPGFAVYDVRSPAEDNDAATHQWLDRLRAASWPAGVTVLIGGEPAAYQDFLNVLTGDVPLVIGSVLLLTFLLLAISFRSIALPLKAVLMNLLSVAAALGVLTWVFQEGHLAGQLHFQTTGFTDATVPVIIFAGLFGLSMDYEVFLLSRIREEWLNGRSNAEAVAAGMARTGQVITSAALILVAVTSTLALSQLSLNKGFGVTFAVAILLDATLIRLLLVPAMMRVLGDLNWWPARRRAA